MNVQEKALHYSRLLETKAIETNQVGHANDLPEKKPPSLLSKAADKVQAHIDRVWTAAQTGGTRAAARQAILEILNMREPRVHRQEPPPRKLSQNELALAASLGLENAVNTPKYAGFHLETVRRGMEALRGTELENLIPPDVLTQLEMELSTREEPNGPWVFRGVDVEQLASSEDAVPGPYHGVKKARQAVANGFATTVLSDLVDRDRESLQYVRDIPKAEAILGFKLPSGTLVQHEKVMEHLPNALEAARAIPVSPERQNELLTQIYFERLIPHDDSMMRPRGAAVDHHVKILRALGGGLQADPD